MYFDLDILRNIHDEGGFIRSSITCLSPHSCRFWIYFQFQGFTFELRQWAILYTHSQYGCPPFHPAVGRAERWFCMLSPNLQFTMLQLLT